MRSHPPFTLQFYLVILLVLSIIGFGFWLIKSPAGLGQTSARQNSELGQTAIPAQSVIAIDRPSIVEEIEAVPGASAFADGADSSFDRGFKKALDRLNRATDLTELVSAAQMLPRDHVDRVNAVATAASMCLDRAVDPVSTWERLVSMGLSAGSEQSKLVYVAWSQQRARFCKPSAMAWLEAERETIFAGDGHMEVNGSPTDFPPEIEAGRASTVLSASMPGGIDSKTLNLNEYFHRPEVNSPDDVLSLIDQARTTASLFRFEQSLNALARADAGLFSIGTHPGSGEPPDTRGELSWAAIEHAGCTWSGACGPSSLWMIQMCKAVENCQGNFDYRSWFRQRYGPVHLRQIETLSDQLVALRHAG